MMTSEMFADLKEGFSKILTDRFWPVKVLLGGFLLINPLLLALAPVYFIRLAAGLEISPLLQYTFLGSLAFNVISFWFPLGFTYEVLRRARTGSGRQLPDWRFKTLPRFAREGAVKLIISIFTLIIPVSLWMGFCYLVFVKLCHLPPSMLSMFLPIIMLFVIPFCGVACCRWLDGASIWNCALNYSANWHLFKARWKDYLIASTFLTGLNAVTTGFFYTIPFAAIFGLCLVDTWFGPIYANSVDRKI